MAKRTEEKPKEKKPRGARYLYETKRRYWIRAAVVTLGLFGVIAWTNYPTRGAAAFLWAGGIAGAILAYFVISYYLYRR